MKHVFLDLLVKVVTVINDALPTIKFENAKPAEPKQSENQHTQERKSTEVEAWDEMINKLDEKIGNLLKTGHFSFFGIIIQSSLRDSFVAAVIRRGLVCKVDDSTTLTNNSQIVMVVGKTMADLEEYSEVM